MRKTFGVSTQHYLFSVQTFAKAILSAGGDEYDYALRDRATKQVFADVASGDSELGVIFKTTQNEVVIDAALEEQGLEFHEVAQSAPRVALPASHPLINSTSLTLDDLEDYPYVYFSQGDDIPWEFYEEALADVPRKKLVAATDRASLSELICALNGYTVTSGILVGITDGSLLKTIPLDTAVKLKLGYVTRKGQELDDFGKRFAEILEKNLERYARQ